MNGYNVRDIIKSVSDINQVINLNNIYRNELGRMIENREFMRTFNKIVLVKLMRTAKDDAKLLTKLVMDANRVLTNELKNIRCIEN